MFSVEALKVGSVEALKAGSNVLSRGVEGGLEHAQQRR